MAKPRMSSETLLPVIAAYVLENGLAELSLRPLAKAAGTSDRMLLYHFGSKDALVAALLDHLAQIYSAALDTAFPQGPAQSRKDCIEQVIALTRTEPFEPFMRVWWDIVAGAARGNQAYRDSAQSMMQQLLGWFEAHMPENDPDPAGGARLLFTMIEGTLMLDALGQGHIADQGLSASEL